MWNLIKHLVSSPISLAFVEILSIIRQPHMILQCDFFNSYWYILLLLTFSITQKYIQLLIYSYIAPIAFPFCQVLINFPNTTSPLEISHCNFSSCLSMSLDTAVPLDVVCFKYICIFFLNFTCKFTCLIKHVNSSYIFSQKKAQTKQQTNYPSR